MKKYFYILCTLFAVIALSGCKANEHFEVKAGPDQTIYFPNNLNYQIKTDTKLDVPSEFYLGYMVAKDRNTGLDVPFGIDFKKKSRGGTKAAVGVGWTLLSAGTVGVLSGLMATAVGAPDDVTVGFVGAGAGLALVSMTCLGPMQNMGKLAYKYQFTYLPEQHTYTGNLSSALLHPDPAKDAMPAARKKSAAGQAADVKQVALEQPDNASGTAAKKSRKDYAKNVAGTYTTNGDLLLNGKVDESYVNVDLKIEALDRNMVSVSVIEGGEDFFGEPMAYTVSHLEDGGYLLTLRGLPEATITIAADGAIIYVHPKVLIDGDTYSLRLTGKK